MINNLTFTTLSKNHLKEHLSKLKSFSDDLSWDYWTNEHFLKELNNKWQLSFIVNYKNNLSGYAIASQKTDSSIHLHHIIINPIYRGLGIGKHMMNELYKRAITHDATILTLKVPTINIEAIEFYKSNQFTIDETLTTPDYYFMLRSLQVRGLK